MDSAMDKPAVDTVVPLISFVVKLRQNRLRVLFHDDAGDS